MKKTTTNSSNEFIPIWEYCKKTGVSPQNVYRKIREGKVNPVNFEYREKVVRRLFILKALEIPIRAKK